MPLSVNYVDMYLVGIHHHNSISNEKVLEEYHRGWAKTLIHSLDARPRVSVREHIPAGTYKFDAQVEVLGEKELSQSLATIKEDLANRGFQAKGELDFALIFAQDDDQHYWIDVTDNYDEE
jgi:hypothetical protein